MSDCTPRRHPIPKRLRWQVLERDNHTCQYCGATPQDGALHLDHIIPVADGGKTEADNLITSCEPCNTGKGTGTPAAPPLPDMAEAADDITRRVEAIQRWRTTQSRYEDEVLSAADEIHQQYALSIPYHVIAAAIREYGIEEAVYAAQAVCGRIAYTDPQGQNAYFYGVLRKRRENGEGVLSHRDKRLAAALGELYVNVTPRECDRIPLGADVREAITTAVLEHRDDPAGLICGCIRAVNSCMHEYQLSTPAASIGQFPAMRLYADKDPLPWRLWFIQSEVA